MIHRKECEPESRFYALSRTASTVLAHFISFSFTVFITLVSQPGTSLFSWHPFLMTLSFGFLMTEAILLFSPHGSFIKKLTHKTKTSVHWVVQFLCVFCAVLGLGVISYNKYLNNKSHFTTWHGLFGVITVCVVAVQSLGAVPLVYHSLVKGWSLAKLKRYHAASGLITYLLGSCSLLLGLWSTWFSSSVGEFSWYLSVLCPVLSALIIMNQVSSAYVAKKRLQS